jgi:GT2 family glycosyltransferase
MPEAGLVSFIIIAYNEASNIAHSISSVTSLAGLDKYEVIVVDDASRDGTAQIAMQAAAQNLKVRVIVLPENRGRGYARSTGIAHANGELIATVDGDIILHPDWFLRTRAALDSHHAVGGTAVPDGDVAYIHKRFRLIPRVVGHTTSVTGSNALYRREVFDVVQFDPLLREGEDVALNYETMAGGLSFATVPGLLVTHKEDKSFGGSLRWLFQSGRGATRQLITYHQVRTPDVASAAFVVSAAMGLAAALRGRRLIGATVPVGFILAASAQHICSRFETPKSQWCKIVPAIGADSAMLAAYFTGRLVGLKALRHHRRSLAPLSPKNAL